MIRNLKFPFFWLGLVAALAMIWFGNQLRPKINRVHDQLQVVVPLPLQVFSSFGDRYLAANVGTWRALMVGIQQLSKDEITALTQIQLDASWLNPGHEDDYYLATSTLPWEGKVEQAQTILERAGKARPHDIYPWFFHGMNALHFNGDSRTAVQSAQTAATHAQDENTRGTLIAMAARWAERDDDIGLTITIVEQMARDAKDPGLKHYLNQRVIRLQGLAQLREANKRYVAHYNKVPSDLEQLISSGLIRKIPDDPLGGGYSLKNGRPIMLPPKG